MRSSKRVSPCALVALRAEDVAWFCARVHAVAPNERTVDREEDGEPVHVDEWRDLGRREAWRA